MYKEIIALDRKVTSNYHRCEHLKLGEYAPYLIGTYIENELVSRTCYCQDCCDNDPILNDTQVSACPRCGDVSHDTAIVRNEYDVCTACAETLRLRDMGLLSNGEIDDYRDPDEIY